MQKRRVVFIKWEILKQTYLQNSPNTLLSCIAPCFIMLLRLMLDNFTRQGESVALSFYSNAGA
jgi:hypothetical protein